MPSLASATRNPTWIAWKSNQVVVGTEPIEIESFANRPVFIWMSSADWIWATKKVGEGQVAITYSYESRRIESFYITANKRFCCATIYTSCLPNFSSILSQPDWLEHIIVIRVSKSPKNRSRIRMVVMSGMQSLSNTQFERSFGEWVTLLSRRFGERPFEIFRPSVLRRFYRI